jgi:anti-sigma regulatory factor (Ser/Thr protein kinase)
MSELRHRVELALPFDEFRVWSQRMRPVMADAGIEPGCLDVLEYACTEMLNNVLDHSSATSGEVSFDWNQQSVVVHVTDNGRGIFACLRETLQLESDADAALLLVKGKVTTDPARHTGEGLFFSARACEWFNLQSASTGISLQADGPWVFTTPNAALTGTQVRFRVARQSPPVLRDVFDRYCPQPELKFTRTDVSVGLMKQVDGSLVSRSQGKRLVLGLERFDRVNFDFTGVEAIQQGFADEVFRVWKAAHPEIQLSVSGTEPAVRQMLAHVGFTG